MNFATWIVLSVLLIPTVEAKLVFSRSTSCNDRVRQGPRGTAQALAAFAGCVVLYKARNELAEAAKKKTDTPTATLKKYASVGAAVSLCAGWIYYFASSAAQSFKIFFTDDPDFRSKEAASKESLDTIHVA